MDEVQMMFVLDWKTVIIGIVLIMVVIVFVTDLKNKIFEIFGIEFKSVKERQDDHAMLKEVIDSVKTLKEIREADLIESRNGDKKLEDAILEIGDGIKDITEHLDVLEKRSGANEFAIRQTLADKINERYKKYIKMGGIPDDEYDEFVKIYEAYREIGGNSTAKAKYDYCMKNLSIVPSLVSLDSYIEKHDAFLKQQNNN